MAGSSERYDQQGQRAGHVREHAEIPHHFHGHDAREGKMTGAVLFVNEFVGQNDGGTDEGNDSTETRPGVDPTEHEIHGEKSTPGTQETGKDKHGKSRQR